MKPTYDELLRIVEEQREIITKLQATIVEQRTVIAEQRAIIARQETKILKLEGRIVELEEKLNKNSKNSSKPPSTDLKQNKRSPRGGGRTGHVGHHRALVPKDQVTHTVRSSLDACPHCGSKSLSRLEPSIFQQVELPKIEPIVAQIERGRCRCTRCGKRSLAPMPEEYEVSAFGPRLSALVGTLTAVHRMGKRSTQSLLKSVCNIDISLGSISAIEARLSGALEFQDRTLVEATQQNEPAYVDETSFRQGAKNCFVWTINTRAVSLLRILPSRGINSLAWIRPRGHPGITVTDRYSVYRYPRHQYCLAHLKRDFMRFAEKLEPDKQFAKRLLFDLGDVFSTMKLYRTNLIQLQEMRRRIGYRRRSIKQTLEDVVDFGSEKFARFASTLLRNFQKLFLFTRHPEIECTNNTAERSLRHIVMWRKTSYGTQSESGSRFLERVLSIWMTLKRSGRDVFEFLVQAYRARTGCVQTPSVI